MIKMFNINRYNPFIIYNKFLYNIMGYYFI